MTTAEQATDRIEDRVARRLGDAYGLDVVAVERVPFGVETDNFSVRLGDGGRVFAKAYRAGEDLRRQGTRVASARFARERGVPVPAVIPDRSGSDDQNGHYSLWLDTRNNPLQVIVAQTGYQGQERTMKIAKGTTTTASFVLKKE